eukprot:11821999-Alexandrium_andersonii.AAC.1
MAHLTAVPRAWPRPPPRGAAAVVDEAAAVGPAPEPAPAAPVLTLVGVLAVFNDLSLIHI